MNKKKRERGERQQRGGGEGTSWSNMKRYREVKGEKVLVLPELL